MRARRGPPSKHPKAPPAKRGGGWKNPGDSVKPDWPFLAHPRRANFFVSRRVTYNEGMAGIRFQRTPWDHLYNCAAWARASAAYRAAHPVCEMCESASARVTDHIRPHKGDLELFWDADNWQALCKRCHDSVKQQIDRTGFHTQVGADGWPLDPNHPANAEVPRAASR